MAKLLMEQTPSMSSMAKASPSRVSLPADADKAAVEAAAKANSDVLPYLEGKTVRKVIVVKNIVNIVVG